MSDASMLNTYRVDTAELHTALEAVLSEYFGSPRTLETLQRRPVAYRSSFALEELAVTLDNGQTLPLVFKDVSRQALSAAGMRAKPTFLYHPRREIETYRHILAVHLPDAARCYGAVVDDAEGRYWLFLEKVTGAPLDEVEMATWQQVARWLATMHTYFGRQAGLYELATASHLLCYDDALFRRWPRRAQLFLRQLVPTPRAEALERFDHLVANYDRVIEHLLALPVTLIHGEFYAANVLVQETTDYFRVCPVDWEMAALGPGLLDLAALIAGQWTETEKRDLALAYYDSLMVNHGWRPSMEEFLFALDCCRLHVAIQWLGWSADWTPPPHQTQNWLDESLRVAERVMRDTGYAHALH